MDYYKRVKREEEEAFFGAANRLAKNTKGNYINVEKHNERKSALVSDATQANHVWREGLLSDAHAILADEGGVAVVESVQLPDWYRPIKKRRTVGLVIDLDPSETRHTEVDLDPSVASQTVATDLEASETRRPVVYDFDHSQVKGFEEEPTDLTERGDRE